MILENTKKHWENIYQTKQPNEVSWTQEIPKTSLEFIRNCNIPKTAKIIDIGGGDSNLVDFLLAEGYQNISILDISAKALDRAKKRLGKKAEKVNWIVSDVTKFKPEVVFDVWHDRAAFHFLTTPEQIKSYLDTAAKSVKGFMTIGTFSDVGPKKCSGLEIKQYSETELETQLAKGFEKLKCITEDHQTPFGTTQNFLFCSFRKKPNSI
jgi:2-polyprenyl-3-methyl-5-hydroxy-6-metoxy-1,4-benzoquinol methylase